MNQRNTTKEHGNAMIDLSPTMETNAAEGGEDEEATEDTDDASEHSEQDAGDQGSTWCY